MPNSLNKSQHSLPDTIPALLPQTKGHQFVCYADACSGVPGAPHEATFAAVNAVVSRLDPPPEFICFPGDEIIGLTADDEALREQWHYWFGHEIAWLDREAIPLYHTTANHTAYDPASEAIYRDVLSHLPQNGPPEQKGLTYFVRKGNLLMVFVNTMWSGLGGEGHVETDWLNQTLTNHADAKFKLVFGHHPVFSVNGFSGPYQRDIEPENGRDFWQVLVRHQVLAYVCSHILAFDVQVHEGVLQILTAGAGTAHRMPEGVEYLHCVQAALDADGLRYQVLDTTAQIREWLKWPLELPPSSTWQSFDPKTPPLPYLSAQAHLITWRITGIAPPEHAGAPQTLLCGWDSEEILAPLWIGLRGRENRLSILLAPVPGRSPHLWVGPSITPGSQFQMQIAIHTGMGPGGFLWRWDDTAPWSSFIGASAQGTERFVWPTYWHIGYDQRGVNSQPFRGRDLQITWHTQIERLIND